MKITQQPTAHPLMRSEAGGTQSNSHLLKSSHNNCSEFLKQIKMAGFSNAMYFVFLFLLIYWNVQMALKWEGYVADQQAMQMENVTFFWASDIDILKNFNICKNI
ncbi:unnamed protein product [Ceratitis capitata]|uniref:(Mediterranean fruit fly) hypothetical protein n=1 Tax=Ceratitis capitata TaxID=7213 RepID=A0A811USQ3_CERCA|nr:unnamed protein product [Ceratitis capitata]